MKTFLTVCSLIAVVVFVGAQVPKKVAPPPWGQIRLLYRERIEDVNTYLKSLSTEEMLTAARQACREVQEDTQEYREAPKWAVAEFHCIICLRFYFDKVDRDMGGAALLKIVGDQSEPHLLRRAMISRMWETDVPFDGEFQAYVSKNEAKVTAVLTNILKGRDDDAMVRKEAMQCLGVRLGRQVSEIIRSDPNMRETLKEKRKHTSRVIRANELVRSGEVSLTEETMKALEPVEARTIAYVKLLGAIVADDENEPEELRKEARRRLEIWRRSRLTGLDDEVEKALQQAAG